MNKIEKIRGKQNVMVGILVLRARHLVFVAVFIVTGAHRIAIIVVMIVIMVRLDAQINRFMRMRVQKKMRANAK